MVGILTGINIAQKFYFDKGFGAERLILKEEGREER